MKKLFKIIDMHCSSCALTIDMDLGDLEGVAWSRTSYAKAQTEVEFNPQKTSEDLILQTIKQSGYSAIPI